MAADGTYFDPNFLVLREVLARRDVAGRRVAEGGKVFKSAPGRVRAARRQGR